MIGQPANGPSTPHVDDLKRVPPRTRILAGILVTTVIIALFAMAEWYLQWSEPAPLIQPSSIPGLPYELVPNARQRIAGIEYRTNSLGFRGEEVPLTKPKAEYRVLVLGDSIVYGATVREEDGLTAQLQRRWNQNRSDGRVRVVNAGVTSYNVEHYLTLFMKKTQQLDPDYLVIGIFMNDHEAYIPQERMQLWKSVEGSPQLWQRSYVIKALRSRLRSLPMPFPRVSSREGGLDPIHDPVSQQYIPDRPSLEALSAFIGRKGYSSTEIIRGYMPFLYEMSAWNRIREPLSSFAWIIHERRIPGMVVIFPLEFQIEPDFRYPEPQRTIIALCQSLGLPVMDATPVLREVQQQVGHSIYERSGDLAHFNAEGHLAVAQAIFQFQESALQNFPKESTQTIQ